MMRYLRYSLALSLTLLAASCYKAEDDTDKDAAQDVKADKTDARITHEDGWTVVSKTENGNRVYWFLAPEVDSVSPAMFKKTIYDDGTNELESSMVSECEAPKPTCDALMKKFEELSEAYK